MKYYLISSLVLFFIVAPAARVHSQTEVYTFTCTQSTAGYQFWTAPPSERIFKTDAVPTPTGSPVLVYAAKNESEPFQIVVKPASSGAITVSVGAFGSGITVDLYQVKYVAITTATDNLGKTGPYPDPLWPLSSGATVAVTANENTAFWFNVNVAPSVASGNYTANMTIAGIAIPVRLHVFNFSIAEQLHVDSRMNFSFETILDKYSVPGAGAEYWMYVDGMKKFFIDHRLTPRSVCWPGGLCGNGAAPFIDYDCATAAWTDNDGIWGFEHPANKYLNGIGFNNGAGFPSFQCATFRNNDAGSDQRPDTFCGLTRSSSDWVGGDVNSAYNLKWKQYMTSMQNYLSGLGYLDRAYYYFANEPQDQTDYDAVAWYANLVKSAAPNLHMMVSEGPRPEIYSNSSYPNAQIDVWIPVFNEYDQTACQNRQRNHQEDIWIYFLYGTRPPYFNPITLDHPGIESKFTGWLLWKYRISGITYYSLNNWSKNPWTDPMTDGHNGDWFMWYPPAEDNTAIVYGSNNHRFVPSIRFELMRDSFEDYEYFYVLSGNSRPILDVSNDADTQVNKVITSLTSYTRNSEFMYNLRRLIGLKNGGETATIPDIQPPVGHPRSLGDPGNYYINFQNPAGSPTADPLVVNGKTYIKIGWNAYDQALGYGWYGDLAHVMYQYQSSGPNELQKSILYDDWGRTKVFEYDLPCGTYNVTVSCGWYNGTYPHQKIDVEGLSFMNDEGTTPAAPYLVRTRTLTITDYKLTMNMGIFNEYTMLNYMNIEAVSSTSQVRAKLFLDGAYNSVSGSMEPSLHSLLPTVSPYSDAPATVSGSIPANAVDWVKVELRSTAAGSGVKASCFVNTSGNLMDLTGVEGITMSAMPGDYYIVISHRNHAAVMSAIKHTLLAGSSTVYDFTTGTNKYYGTGGCKLVDAAPTAYGLWAGDANQDKLIDAADFSVWQTFARLGSVGYLDQDMDMDGFVTSRDYVLWFNNNSNGGNSQVP
jgi:hypothetical protein